jgi:hypothetical protein
MEGRKRVAGLFEDEDKLKERYGAVKQKMTACAPG